MAVRAKLDLRPAALAAAAPPAHVDAAGRLRPRSENLAQQRRALRDAPAVTVYARPATRADCIDGPRPCPWVGCRYSLYCDVNHVGSIKYNQPCEPWEVEESCALDVAERTEHGLTLGQVGKLLSITRERVRQLELHALIRLQATRRLLGGKE